MTNRTNTTGSVNNPARRDAITLAILPTGGKLELQTAIATTSGTAWNYTGISADVKKITIEFVGFSTSDTSIPIIQLGDAGGVETSGYQGSSGESAGDIQHNTGFNLDTAWNSSRVTNGAITLTLLDASNFIWACSGVVGPSSTARSVYVGGSKTLSAALDRIRVTTVGGSDTGDAGSINIILE